MGIKTIIGLKLCVLMCMCILVMAACQQKKVSVSPPPTPDVSETGDMGTPDSEMADAEEIRQQRLAALKAEEEAKAMEGIMTAKIYFEFDRSDLSADARGTLKEIAGMLTSHPSWTADIQGHCDERGTIEYNLALGERRARAAKKYIVDLGISSDRLSTISYGEERPVDPRSMEEAWAKNRRCEFDFIK